MKLRKFKILGIVLLTIICITGGCSVYHHILPSDARKILDNAQTITVYLLDPDSIYEKDKDETAEKFQGYKVEKTKVVTDRSVIGNLIGKIKMAVLHTTFDYWQIMCFNPRHGIQATTEDGECYLLICFECSQIECITAKGHFHSNMDDNAKEILVGLVGAGNPTH
jgi:hypothetical protein